MNRLFVDTSAWMAIVDAEDANHSSAVVFQAELAETCRLMVTNYVLDELYTLVLMDLGYTQAVGVKRKLDLLCAGEILETIWVDRELEAEGWKVFERFNRDKRWSFTDCIS